MISVTGKEDKNDGVFFMDFDDFILWFNKVTVCEVLPHN